MKKGHKQRTSSRLNATKIIGLMAAIGAFVFSLSPTSADGRPTIFDKGRSHGSIAIGSVSTGEGDYGLLVGAGYGYFVEDGLDVRMDVDMTVGAEPFMSRATPGVQYVMYFIPGIHPYVGSFYRHWFIGSGEDDMESVGARLGGIYVNSANTYIQVGAVWENIFFQCREGMRCSDMYPEIMVSLAF